MTRNGELSAGEGEPYCPLLPIFKRYVITPLIGALFYSHCTILLTPTNDLLGVSR